MMFKTTLASVVCLGIAVSTAWGFDTRDSQELVLDSGGTPLITSDFLFADPAGANDELAGADGWEASDAGDGRAVNVWRASSDWLDYRREICASDERAELAIRFRLYAYHERDVGVVRYGFRVPVNRLDGFAFRAHTGRPYQQKIVEGTLSKDCLEGQIVGRMAYLTLTGPSEAFTLDFAPAGQGLVYNNMRNYGIIGNNWAITRAGDFFEFSFALGARWHGGMMTSKVVFLKGEHPYADMHPVPDERHYGIGPLLRLGAVFYENAPEGFVALGLDEFDADRKVGWTSVDGLRLAPAVLGQMVTGKRGTLRCQVEPGHYLVTVRFGAEAPMGPFSLRANGMHAGSGLTASAGEVTSHTFSVRLPKGTLDLAFEGEQAFGVSAVVLQQFMSTHEDTHTLRRDLFQAKGIPTPDKYVDPGTPPEGDVPPIAANADWRWNMAMADLGPSNTGSWNELNRYEDIERRILELKESGFNTIICNGLHFRLCHLSTRPMQQRNMKMVCDVAHRHGFRVIEHHDVPLMLAQNEGYQTLIQHVDWLQRGITTGRVSTYFCINNPNFMEWYYDWFERYAKATGIDGSMLDEVTFFSPNYCGCKHCRAKFTAETGLRLPYKDEDGIFLNKDEALWVEWEQFRMRSATDFFKEIRAIFDRVNPAASMLTYTTHYGFTSSYGSRRFGGDIVDRARYLDFLGTEIMSRNVYESHRAVFALRKAKGALMHHFNSPVYGLVYHVNQPHIAYFGWALQHMNRQVTWLSSIEGEDMTRYVNWKDKMNTKDARLLSEVAVVFSRPSCNYNRKTSHASNVLGCSEVLSDAHIQHDMILDLDLTPEHLKAYRLVILPSVECLSADYVQALESYVRDGGTLLLTGYSSHCDQNGMPRGELQLGALAGVELTEATPVKPLRIRIGGGDAFELVTSAPRVKAKEGTKVLAEILKKDGDTLAPAVTEQPVDKGRCIYSALSIGGVNYSPELTLDQKYSFVPNEPMRDLLLDIVARSKDKPLTFESVDIPEKVLTTAYRAPGGYAVHFLNATGVNLAPGDVIGKEPRGEVFPALQNDLVFDLQVEGITGGRVVSPDYSGEHPAEIAPLASGTRVTVPAEAVKGYSIVYLAKP